MSVNFCWKEPIKALETELGQFEAINNSYTGITAQWSLSARSSLVSQTNALIRQAYQGVMSESETRQVASLNSRVLQKVELSWFKKQAIRVYHAALALFTKEDSFTSYSRQLADTQRWGEIYSEYQKAEAHLHTLLPRHDTFWKAYEDMPCLEHLFEHSLKTAELLLGRWKTAATLEAVNTYQATLKDDSTPTIDCKKSFLKLPENLQTYLKQCLTVAIRANEKQGSVSVDDLEDNPRILLSVVDSKGRNLLEQLEAHLDLQIKAERSLTTLHMIQDELGRDSISLPELQALTNSLNPKVRAEVLAKGLQNKPTKNAVDSLIEREDSLYRGSLKQAFDPADARLRGYDRSFLSAERLLDADSKRDLCRPVRATFVAVECTGVHKQGGLAEAVFGMASAMAAQTEGNKVRLILPKYDVLPEAIKSQLKHKQALDVTTTDGKVCQVFKAKLNELSLYFIEDAEGGHFNISDPESKLPPSIYGPDDVAVGARFACFSDAASKLLNKLAHKTDIIHLHDWHTAAVAPLVKHRYKEMPPVVFTFHNNNQAAQGIYNYPKKTAALKQFGIADGNANLFVEALKAADAVTTVSETFACEAQSPELGATAQQEVANAAAQGKLTGILNGANPQVWNPETDSQLKNWYSPLTATPIDLSYGPQDNIMRKRALIRDQLQDYIEVHAPEVQIDFDKPIITYVGRYDAWQKGLDMLEPAIEEALASGGQFICMGSQEDPRASKILTSLQKKYPKGVWIIRDRKGPDGRYQVQQGSGLVPGIGSLVRAATDFTIVPSEFEPCGLVQFEGWLFGTQAIGSSTGGLADSIIEEGPHRNGYLFPRREKWLSSAQKQLVRDTVGQALNDWKELSLDERNALSQRLIEEARQMSWTTSVEGLTPIERYRLVYSTAENRAKQQNVLFLDTQLGQ